jgi:HSP20 family protein
MTWRHENHGFPSLRSEVEALFSDVLGRGRAAAAASSRWLPSLDLLEEPDAYVVELDMPGVSLKDLSISVAGRHLTLSGRRQLVRDYAAARIRVRERWSGAFSRSIELPGPVDAERLTATLHEGILRIVLPRQRTSP